MIDASLPRPARLKQARRDGRHGRCYLKTQLRHRWRLQDGAPSSSGFRAPQQDCQPDEVLWPGGIALRRQAAAVASKPGAPWSGDQTSRCPADESRLVCGAPPRPGRRREQHRKAMEWTGKRRFLSRSSHAKRRSARGVRCERSEEPAEPEGAMEDGEEREEGEERGARSEDVGEKTGSEY